MRTLVTDTGLRQGDRHGIQGDEEELRRQKSSTIAARRSSDSAAPFSIGLFKDRDGGALSPQYLVSAAGESPGAALSQS
jgi:hypothetical protein